MFSPRLLYEIHVPADDEYVIISYKMEDKSTEKRRSGYADKQAGIVFDLFSSFCYEDAPLIRRRTETGMSLDAVLNRQKGRFSR
jgi:hypothetical protein